MISVCILGGNGTIGRALRSFLIQDPEICVSTLAISDYLLGRHHFDVVYYCIGVTSDFQTIPFRTMEAHVELLSRVLETNRFNTLVYLSSTRVYKNSMHTQEESFLTINPHEIDSIYNISKLAGESLCMLTQNDRIRIVRLSNVVGGTPNENSFLGFLRKSLQQGSFQLNSSLKSERDFVDIEQILFCLKEIGLKSTHKVYNVASGFNLRTEEIIEAVFKSFSFSYKVQSNENVLHTFPIIDISRISGEFNIRHYEKEDIIRIILSSMNGFDHAN